MNTDDDDAQKRRDIFRHASRALIDAAAAMTAQSGGYFSPVDTARLLLAAGSAVLGNTLGRAATVAHLRTLADALDRGDSTDATLN